MRSEYQRIHEAEDIGKTCCLCGFAHTVFWSKISHCMNLRKNTPENTNLWARRSHHGWVKCSQDDPGAILDINTAVAEGFVDEDDDGDDQGE